MSYFLQSVTNQAGIFAGEDGYDIEVGKNTDLKGAVIASKADESKNRLSTDTITYSDIENKAEYSASNKGVNVNTDKDAKLNEKGITPDIGVKAQDDAKSTTKSAISKGTIEVRSDKNKDLSGLSRDTENALNKLGQIFDKKKVQEKQELAKVFGEEAFKAVGDLVESKWKNAKIPEEKAEWAEGGEYKVLLHGVVGGIMSELGGNGLTSGAAGAGISKLLQNQLSKIKDPEIRLIVSSLVGATVSKIVGENGQVGASTALSGIKNNDYCHKPTYEGAITYTEENRYQQLVNGEYVSIDKPLEGVYVWKQNPKDTEYGWDYKIGTTDSYCEDVIIWKKFTIINGDAYGITLRQPKASYDEMVKLGKRHLN